MKRKLSAPLRALVASVLLLLSAACASGPAAARLQAQPGAGGMVAAADPRAVAAGTEILARGGGAVDAAIAAMAVLGLVEPQSAGLGGGGFLTAYDAERGRVLAFEGRETAPAGATPTMFLDAAGRPLDFRSAALSGRSVGAPGLVPMLALAHKAEGRLPWRDLFQPAITLAEQGFVVSPRLHQLLRLVAASPQGPSPALRAYLFGSDGAPLPAGTRVFNPAYAETLKAIAQRGPRALSHGPIADEIVRAVAAGPMPGTLQLSDLAAYTAKQVTPVCAAHRGHRVCTAAPPSSGVIVLELISLYERARPQPEGPTSADDWSAFLWASRLAMADRDKYVADDAFSPTPTYGLIAPAYLDARARLITPARAPVGEVQAGDPGEALGGPPLRLQYGGDPTARFSGTTHLTVVDSRGDVAALTASVESIFGSQRMAGGFLLNNQLTDFSFVPTRDGVAVANAVAPGKRPRSSMSPTIVLDPDGRFRLAVGSPGGSAIIPYVAKALVGSLDWGLTLQEAVNLPNMSAIRTPAAAEIEKMSPALVAALESRGWALRPVTLETSGLHGVEATGLGLVGAVDPRREGAAAAP